MAVKDKIPEIRFAGFKDDWEQRKLGDLGKTQSGIGFSESEQGGTDGVPFFKVSDMSNLGNEHEMKTANNYVSLEQLQRWKWKPIENVPAVIFAKVGAAIMLNRKRIVRRPFLIDNNTMAYVFNNSWDEDFGKTLFETIPLPQYAQVGALPSYNSSDIEAIEVCVPVREEQTKIAEFFVKLDNLITLHQRKYDKLLIVKKSMLEKMFPKDGANVPEIRFVGFTDAWERRKLGDVCIELKQYETLESGYPLLTSSRSGLMFQYEYRDSVSTKNKETLFSVVPYGKCTYRHMSDDDIFHFNLNYISQNGLVSREYPVFDSSDDNCLAFIVEYLNSCRQFTQFCKEQKLGGTRTRLYYKNLCEFELMIPRSNEQKKIAEFFANIDELITLHQCELEKLKNIKKSLLEKMFV